MGKRGIVFVLFVTIILSWPVFAQSGCFLEPDSPFYCHDISEQQAQEACANSKCQLQEVFRTSQACLTVPDCQTFLCKSTCREELAGRCPSGKAPDGWCQSGCCQYDYGDQVFCDTVTSRYLCELHATNDDAKQYVFRSDLAENECPSRCSAGFIGGEATIVGEKKEPKLSLSEQPSAPLPWKLIATIVGIVVAALAVTWLTRRVVRRFQQPPEQPTAPSPFWKALSPFSSNPLRQKHIQQLHQQHQKKVKHHERDNFLAEQGLTPELPPEQERKLHHLAKRGNLPEPPQDPFEQLKNIGKK